VRTILKLHRSLTTPLPQRTPPADFDIAKFVPSLHKEEWLVLNNRIFAHHPDQGNWAMEDLENRMKEPWFDTDGFYIAVSVRTMIGFCWVKIHHDLVNQDPVGEIYVMGVDPDAKQKGIGTALGATALEYMVGKHLNTAMLYVDADNEAGLALYRKLGFS
jgi:mycothiol synthase